MMNKIETTKGTWRVYGLYFIPTDATYDILKKAIETGNLRQTYLQQVTGWHSPIIVDMASKEMYFS